MQDLCIVSECSAEARHYIRTSRKPGVTFMSCNYHASGVYVKVSDVYGGNVSIRTSFVLTSVNTNLQIGSRQGRHELAG